MKAFDRKVVVQALRAQYFPTQQFLDLQMDVVGRLRSHARFISIVGNVGNGRWSAALKIVLDARSRAIVAATAITPIESVRRRFRAEQNSILIDLINGLNGPSSLVAFTRSYGERFSNLLQTHCRRDGKRRVIYLLSGMDSASPQIFSHLEHARVLGELLNIEVQYIFLLTPPALKRLTGLLQGTGTNELIGKFLAHSATLGQFPLRDLSKILAEVDSVQAPVFRIDGSEEHIYLVANLLPKLWEANWRLSNCDNVFLRAMEETALALGRKLPKVLPIPIVANFVIEFLCQEGLDEIRPTTGLIRRFAEVAIERSGLAEHLRQF